MYRSDQTQRDSKQDKFKFRTFNTRNIAMPWKRGTYWLKFARISTEFRPLWGVDVRRKCLKSSNHELSDRLGSSLIHNDSKSGNPNTWVDHSSSHSRSCLSWMILNERWIMRSESCMQLNQLIAAILLVHSCILWIQVFAPEKFKPWPSNSNDWYFSE